MCGMQLKQFSEGKFSALNAMMRKQDNIKSKHSTKKAFEKPIVMIITE